MAFDGDPYRILGLARGASLDEVKRAYRRLAKSNHPDAAGSVALPRFLAIQAAYEQLVEGSAGAGAGPRRPASGARRASEADPGRADATRRAHGGRARGRRPTDEPPGRGQTAGQTPGASGGGRAGRARPTEGTDAGPNPEAGRRRGKATLGSTSYDEAYTGPVEPDWSGASWYGTTSGTYWTLNPKEYADPRKHGPDYQARARRAWGARPDAGASAPWSQPGPDLEARGAGPEARGAGAPASEDAPQAGRTAAEAGETAEFARPAHAGANLARALTDPRTRGLRGHVMRAFLGWLPVALGLGWFLGELSGCGRFAATCDPSVDPFILLIQGAALVALLLLPPAASLAASAALGLIASAVAATLILSATGAAADEGSRRATLGVLLLVGWLAGLAIAIVLRVRSASSRVGPVS